MRIQFSLTLFISFMLGLAASQLTISVANATDTVASYVILIDDQTGAVMLEKNADSSMYPASMSKLMTAYIAFDRLSSGNISLEDSFRVSEKAWRKGGSRMFVELGSRVEIEDLLRGMIIQSGNDASIVLAEGISGSEEIFVSQMNLYAKKIGLNNSHFTNATGWPDPKHVTTARDLSILAQRLIHDFPEYIPYYAEKSFSYNGIKQGNRNPLLYKNIGADGLKTGHTDKSGYGLVATAKRGKRRLILVVNGLNSVKQRSREAERLIDWGFRAYNNFTLFSGGDVVKNLPVWLGKEEEIAAVLKNDLVVTMMPNERKNLRVTIIHKKPVTAPISQGEIVGVLKIKIPGLGIIEKSLVAANDVDELGVIGRLRSKIFYLLFGGITGNY